MTDQELIILLGQRIAEQNKILQELAAAVMEIAGCVKQFVMANNPGPNYRKSLKEFAHFDWSEIGATVVKRDSAGPASVEWNGKVFTRRSPNNKFDVAIWFSRCIGKDDAGNNRYEKLITFKDTADAEDISPKAQRIIESEGR